MRFFTPVKEVPICGHATIAAHYVRALEKKIHSSETVVQRTDAGLLPIDILCEENDYRIVMTQGEFSIRELPKAKYENQILRAPGLREEDRRRDCPMVIASTGHGKVMVGIKDRERLDCLSPDMEALKRISAEMPRERQWGGAGPWR